MSLPEVGADLDTNERKVGGHVIHPKREVRLSECQRSQLVVEGVVAYLVKCNCYTHRL